MKRLTALILLIIAANSFADPFPGTTTPGNMDRDTQSLWKINRLLDDAASGAKPIQVATSGTATTVAVVSGTSLTTSGTIAAGARQVILTTSSNYAGTVLGATFNASETQTISAPDGMTLSAIPFTISSGTLRALKTN